MRDINYSAEAYNHQNKIFFRVPFDLKEALKEEMGNMSFNSELKQWFLEFSSEDYVAIFDKTKKFFNGLEEIGYEVDFNVNFDEMLIESSKASELIEEKKRRTIKNAASGMTSIFEQKEVKEQSIENFIWQQFENKVYVNQNTGSVHFYDDETGVFVATNEILLAAYIGSEIESQGLFKFDKQSYYNSASKTIFSKLMTKKDKHIKFSSKYICFKFRTEQDTTFFAHMKISIDSKTNDLFMEVSKPLRSNKCYTQLFAELRASQIENFNMKDFNSGKSFKYNLCDYNEKKDTLMNYFLNTSIAQKSHQQVLFQHIAASLYEKGIQKILLNIGPGGDGKSVINKNIQMLWGSDSYKIFNLEGNYLFKMMSLINSRFVAVTEVEGLPDEDFLKRVSGNDNLKIEIKNGLARDNYGTNDMTIMMFLNDSFKVSDQGRSTTRRYNAISWNNSTGHVVLDIENMLWTGGIWRDHEGKMHETYSEQHLFADAVLKGLLEIAASEGECLQHKNLHPEVMDFTNIHLKKMVVMKEFFSDYEIEYNPNRGTTKNDVYNAYNEFLRLNGYKEVSMKKFSSAFSNEFSAHFGFIYADQDLRAKMRDGRRVKCYPVVFKNNDKPALDLETKDKSSSNVISIKEAEARKSGGFKAIQEETKIDKGNYFILDGERIYDHKL